MIFSGSYGKNHFNRLFSKNLRRSKKMAVSEETKWKLLKFLVVKQLEWRKPSDIRREIGNIAKALEVPEAEIAEIVEAAIRENAEEKNLYSH